MKRAVLVLSALAVGSVGTAGCDAHCWFDLAAGESSRKLLVVRSCPQDGNGELLGVALDDPWAAPVEIGHGRYSRVALGEGEAWIAASTTGRRVDFYTIDPPSMIKKSAAFNGNVAGLAPTPDATGVWVALWGRLQSGVALLDTVTGSKQVFVPFEGDPLRIEFLPEENAILAASSGQGRVTKIHAARFEQLAATPTSGALDFALLGSPPRVALLEDRSQRVSVRELAHLEVEAELEIGLDARKIASSQDRRTFAVTERDPPALRVFDGQHLEQQRYIELDGEPEALAVTNDGRAFVGLNNEDAIAVIDLATGVEKGRIEF
jgi:hypothetical protein